jgi:hypothetical protein
MAAGSVQEEYDKVHLYFRLVALVAVLVLTGGAVFYHFVEKLSWLNSFYFCTITLTTVGYGDITPHTSLGKLFTIFYVIVGVGILATFANLLIRNAATRRELRHGSLHKGKKDD